MACASTSLGMDASPPTPRCRRYPRLFEPLQIGSVRLRNRLFKTAAESCFIDASGGVEPELLNDYESLAAGGVGLVIVESPTIDFPLSMTNFHGSRLDQDRYRGVAPVVERVGDCREPGLILTAVGSGARVFDEQKGRVPRAGA